MTTVLLTIAMFTVCGLIVAASGGEPARSTAPTAQLAPAATAPLPAGPLAACRGRPATAMREPQWRDRRSLWRDRSRR